jgi:uncharacterized protein with GYD domain
MPTYIVLAHFTAEAKRNPAEALQNRQKRMAAFKEKGLKFTSYTTMGPYDLVTIVESPSEELAVKLLLTAGEMGDVDTTTLRAFSAEEIQKIRAL